MRSTWASRSASTRVRTASSRGEEVRHGRRLADFLAVVHKPEGHGAPLLLYALIVGVCDHRCDRALNTARCHDRRMVGRFASGELCENSAAQLLHVPGTPGFARIAATASPMPPASAIAVLFRLPSKARFASSAQPNSKAARQSKRSYCGLMCVPRRQINSDRVETQHGETCLLYSVLTLTTGSFASASA